MNHPPSCPTAFSRLAAYNQICDGIRMLLPWIATTTVDATLELNSGALLDDMGRFVCRGVKVGCSARECNVTTESIGARSKRLRCLLGVAASMRLHARHIMTPEARLDTINVGQRAAYTAGASLRDCTMVLMQFRCGDCATLDR